MEKSVFNFKDRKGKSASLREGDYLYLDCYYKYVAVIKGVVEEGEYQYIETYAACDIENRTIIEDKYLCTIDDIVEYRQAEGDEEYELKRILLKNKQDKLVEFIENNFGQLG